MCKIRIKLYLVAMEAQSALWRHVVMECPLSQLTILFTTTSTTYHRKMINLDWIFVNQNMQKAPAPHMKTGLLKTGQECRVTREGKKNLGNHLAIKI